MALRRAKMNKIEFEQISNDEIEVIIPPETPILMVQQLTKSFTTRGLVEDLQKSTLSVRYFYRPADKINNLADKLIKSLQDMTKADELPYWHPKAQMANQKRVRDMERGVASTPALPTAPAAPTAPVAAPKIADTSPAAAYTARGSGRRYAHTSTPIKKDEHGEDCTCSECEVAKSNYGPKGSKQYNPADNARRKANNMDPVGAVSYTHLTLPT